MKLLNDISKLKFKIAKRILKWFTKSWGDKITEKYQELADIGDAVRMLKGLK